MSTTTAPTPSVVVATPPAPVFQPSPVLVELHATAKRLERELNNASIFNPRMRMRLDRARATANGRWAAEVRAFEQANPSTAPESSEDES